MAVRARSALHRLAFAAAVVVVAATEPVAARATGWVPTSPAFAAPPCPAGTSCVDVDATRPLGPVDLTAQGLLFGITTTSNPSMISALHPRSWRLTGGEAQAQAEQIGASVTYILSNAWYDSHGPYDPPWRSWPAYASWLRQTVADVVASGQTPDYWEVQNEPDGWYQAIPPESTAQALLQYQLATQIIRSIDPTARIEGPSLLGFFDTPGQGTIDLATFLDFVNSHRLPLAAVSWHEVVGPADHNPNALVAHVAQARALLSHYPRLAHLPIFINEYAPNDSHLIPGWEVGWISAVETARVAQASRSCWHEPDVIGRPVAECGEGGLDGLLQPGSGLPQDLYWVHWAYAQMSGVRINTSGNDPNVAAYATYDAANGKLDVLVGRHASCTAAIRVDCKQPASATPPPRTVLVRIKSPPGWSVASVVSLHIPNVPGPTGFPTSAPAGAYPASGLTVPITGFADGDAYVLAASNS